MASLRLGKSNIEVFAETLLKLAQADPDVLVLTSDSRGSSKLGAFAAALPDQIIEIGIAEQNLVGVAAGLASAGKRVFAVSPASFLTARALEQIKNDVAYSDEPVRLVGISAGVSYGALGSTHHSLHDLAALLALDNIDIVVPADNFETRAAVAAAASHARPLYLRLGKKAICDVHGPHDTFTIGRASRLREGDDVTIVATGETVAPAVLAGEILAARGVGCAVLSMHTIRPFDEQALLEAACDTRAMLTVEEHSIHGGLGSLCASALLQNGCCLPFKIVGIRDGFAVNGSQEDIFRHYGITPEHLADAALALLEPGSGRARAASRTTLSGGA